MLRGACTLSTHLLTFTHRPTQLGQVGIHPEKTVCLQEGFVMAWHVCATFGEGYNPVAYININLIFMFSKIKSAWHGLKTNHDSGKTSNPG